MGGEKFGELNQARERRESREIGVAGSFACYIGYHVFCPTTVKTGRREYATIVLQRFS